ncbi:peptidylprolyl isomerase [Mesorhizobium sp. 1B3]|uniref:peptidylprolyl isomerase n=1 Tax=Mesorhizobium sp. 1B3 TaxID=3243599 RepID=UPI003D981735
MSEVTQLVRVRVETALGSVTVAVDPIRAPLSAGAFLEHVDKGLLAGTTIYRIVTEANQPPDIRHRIEVIQWGRTFEEAAPLPPIAHEPTSLTGLKHRRGTLSMARRETGSAGRAFVFCIGGDLQSLDEGGGRNPDGHGFAAFGEVLDGWRALDAIFARAESGDRLETRIAVTGAHRL